MMSSLSKMNAQEIIEFDHKMRRCAQLAMKSFVTVPDGRQSYSAGSSEEYELPQITDDYLLSFGTLCEYRYPHMKAKKYDAYLNEIKTRLHHILKNFPLSLLHSQQMRLMLPIGVYTVTVNHYFNKLAVLKRATRDADGETNTSKDGAYSHQELCKIVRSISEETTRDRERFFESHHLLVVLLKHCDRQYRKRCTKAMKFGFLRDYAQIDLALHLSEYHEDILYYEESSHIGLFLRDLLSVNSKKDHPVDCILRMYIVNEMDRILVRTGVMNELPPNVFLDVDAPNGVIKWYFESLHPNESSQKEKSFIRHWEKCADNWCRIRDGIINDGEYIMPNFPHSISSENGSFDTLYKEIKNQYSITHEDASNILDFYLNENALLAAQHLKRTSVKYIKANIWSLLHKGRINKEIKNNHSFLNRIRTASTYEKFSFQLDKIVSAEVENFLT